MKGATQRSENYSYLAQANFHCHFFVYENALKYALKFELNSIGCNDSKISRFFKTKLPRADDDQSRQITPQIMNEQTTPASDSKFPMICSWLVDAAFDQPSICY